MDQYKTIFVDAEVDKKTYEPNGDQLARDIQAAIVEKLEEGFELNSNIPIQKTYAEVVTMTSGVILIFKKNT